MLPFFLRGKYHCGENLTPSQLKTMACGLSCILDKDIWGKIYAKYTRKHRLNLPTIPIELN